MGPKSSKGKGKGEDGSESDFADCFDNFPGELVTHILSFLSVEEIQTCTRVCRLFNELANANSIWRIKCIREGRFLEAHMAPFYPTDWRQFYLKQPFTRNLIRNCSGQDDFGHWEVLENGGDKWLVEKDKTGGSKVEPSELLALAGDKQCHFATSYGWCTKRQVVDLVACGLDENVLDELQPPLKVGDWYAARFDCANIYVLEVILLRDREATEENTMDTFNFEKETEQWSDHNWQEVSHVFKDYGPGLRFIQFTHKGKDKQFWAGHYGAKMAGSYVRVNFGT